MLTPISAEFGRCLIAKGDDLAPTMQTLSELETNLFEISLNSTTTTTDTCIGRIRIGAFLDSFECSLEFWKKTDYESQWRKAIQSVVSGSQKACLITSLTDPKTANFLFWWPVYRVDGLIVVQNQVLFLEDCRSLFDLEAPEKLVPVRATVNENGARISEWSMSLTEAQEWLKMRL
jgi:hypothetical protein